MERQLATVRKLDGLSDHPDADRLLIGRVGGWDVVVPVGCTMDTVGLFFEVDSIVPGRLLGEPKGMIVKTRKIRGVLSQGLFVPISDLPASVAEQAAPWPVGRDVTEELEVRRLVRFEEDLGSTGRAPGGRLFSDVCPPGVHKTSEIRLQSREWLLDRLAGRSYYISLKYDGSSATFVLDRGQMKVCSRNLEAGEGSVYHRVAMKYDLAARAAEGRRLVLQGEVYGPGINGNHHEESRLQLAVFGVFDLDRRLYLPLDEMLAVLAELEVPAVEILDRGDDFQYRSVTSLVQLARGKYRNTLCPREGLVVRALDQSYSFKVINNDYLHKFES